MTNRETIKFRVWDTKQKCYLRYYDVNVWHESPLLNDIFENERMVFQQYIGLKDKNGVEIYEGDILKCKGFHGWFDQVGFYYNVVVKHTIVKSGESQITGFAYIPIDREVIGNIFETPELLEK
jgi:uncharacterized phage protein (TIGR01671 family)